ncbi:hypothetical protein H2248_007894 [Termitomyces sp. 'cryptogamus']|nr:hypothetical protein H2248_007894 [Termitomyces sp. 'cryptogamus']
MLELAVHKKCSVVQVMSVTTLRNLRSIRNTQIIGIANFLRNSESLNPLVNTLLSIAYELTSATPVLVDGGRFPNYVNCLDVAMTEPLLNGCRQREGGKYWKRQSF